MDIKNIAIVQSIYEENSLANIYCIHEDLKKSNWLRETFFINKNAEIVAHFNYKLAHSIEQLTLNHDNIFVVKIFDNKNKTYDIVQLDSNKKHQKINSYDDIEFGVENGCFAVKSNGLWGFINEEVQEIIKPQYDNYCAFCSELAAVYKNGKWGFINKQNEQIIPFEYDIPEFSCFNSLYAPVGKEGKFGFIDRAGKVVIPFLYESALCLYRNNKLFPVKQNDKWGFIDITGKVIIPFQYDEVECDGNGYSFYIVSKYDFDRQLYGIVNPVLGEEIVSCSYSSISINEKCICVGVLTEDKTEKFGLIDFDNNKITEFIYDKIYDFSREELYATKYNNKWGYINKSGIVVIDFKYNKANPFYGEYAVVKDDISNKLIHKSGEIFIDSTKNIYNIGAGIFLVENITSTKYELVKYTV